MSPSLSLQPLTIINIIITVSSVGVRLSADLAVSCSAYRGRTGQDMAQVCEGRGVQCLSIAGNKQQTQERLRLEKRGKNKKNKVGVGWGYIRGRKSLAGGFQLSAFSLTPLSSSLHFSASFSLPSPLFFIPAGASLCCVLG